MLLTATQAFQSRLHITLGLDPLSVEDRREIWYHFIRDLKHLSKDDRRVLARHARDDWCHKDFNGRQIRNTVKTALVLARQDDMEVQARHFENVLNIGKLAFARATAPQTTPEWVKCAVFRAEYHPLQAPDLLATCSA